MNATLTLSEEEVKKAVSVWVTSQGVWQVKSVTMSATESHDMRGERMGYSVSATCAVEPMSRGSGFEK